MGTIWIREFRGGLDARRLPETLAGGTLMRARDCHINRGGELEQRSVFTPQYDLVANTTKGLAETSDGLITFGHQASAPAGHPPEIKYMQLAHPGGEALVDVPYVRKFKGKLEVIGTFADGVSYLFYDGVRTTDVNAPPNTPGQETPTALLTYKEKMYVTAGPNLFNSAVKDATDFGGGAGAGSGVIDMSTHSEGAEKLTAIAKYDEAAAIFSRSVIQIFFLDPDPLLSRPLQELENTGTRAARSVTQFGDGDLFYLDRSGVRSLRARDSSNNAATTDIGSAIDPLLRTVLDDLTDEQIERAIGIIEPRDGRFWLALGEVIYVLSYFTATKVSAWTEYRPGFEIDQMIVKDEVVWVRSGDTVYSFGDAQGRPVYDNTVQPEAWTPYLDGDEPFRSKNIDGVDVAARGEWDIRLAYDPENEVAEDLIATIAGTTYGNEKIPAEGQATHVSMRMRCKEPPSPTEPARFSSATIHFERDPVEDSD